MVVSPRPWGVVKVAGLGVGMRALMSSLDLVHAAASATPSPSPSASPTTSALTSPQIVAAVIVATLALIGVIIAQLFNLSATKKSREESKRQFGSRIQPLIMVPASTGLRRGEVLGLRWVDVDLDTSMMRVSGSLSRTTAGLSRKSTKTGRDRSVALPPVAVKTFKAQRAMQAAERLAAGSAWIDSGHVFRSPEGTAMEPRNVSRAYADLAMKAKIEDKGMHAVRHYAATAWLSSGAATVRDIADLLGHSSPVVTLEIYASAIPAAQRAAIDSAAAALEG